jgi:hypothetical protein
MNDPSHHHDDNLSHTVNRDALLLGLYLVHLAWLRRIDRGRRCRVTCARGPLAAGLHSGGDAALPGDAAALPRAAHAAARIGRRAPEITID